MFPYLINVLARYIIVFPSMSSEISDCFLIGAMSMLWNEIIVVMGKAHYSDVIMSAISIQITGVSSVYFTGSFDADQRGIHR